MPMPSRQATVPQGVRSRVYRRIVDQLQRDPVLQTVVKTWSTRLGNANDAVRSNAATAVHVALRPRIGAMGRRFVESWTGWLQVRVYLYPLGSAIGAAEADYCLDLAELLENAIYPPPATDSPEDAEAARLRRLAFQAELVKLGATTGEIEFVEPPTETEAGDGECVGMLQVEIRRTLNV